MNNDMRILLCMAGCTAFLGVSLVIVLILQFRHFTKYPYVADFIVSCSQVGDSIKVQRVLNHGSVRDEMVFFYYYVEDEAHAERILQVVKTELHNFKVQVKMSIKSRAW